MSHAKKPPSRAPRGPSTLLLRLLQSPEQPVDAEVMLNFQLASNNALDAMRRGEAHRSHWDDLADCFNHCETLVRLGFVAADRQVLATAQDGLRRARDRFVAGQALGFDGATLQAMREIVQVMDESIETLSARAWFDCYQITKREIAQAAKCPSNVVVEMPA